MMTVKNYLVNLSWLIAMIAFNVFAEDAQLTCHISKVDDSGTVVVKNDGSYNQKIVTQTLNPVAMRGPMKYYSNETFNFGKLSWKVNLVADAKEVTWNVSTVVNKEEFTFKQALSKFGVPVVFSRPIDKANSKVKIVCELYNNLIPALDGKDKTDCTVGNSIFRIYRKVVGTKQDGSGETLFGWVLSEISKTEGSDKFSYKNYPLSNDNANYTQKQLTPDQKNNLTSYFESLKEGRGELFKKTFSEEKIKKYVDNSTSQTFVSQTIGQNIEGGNEKFYTTIRIYRRADKKKNYILKSELAANFASAGELFMPIECKDL